ncbi:MAG: hypothetical protein ABEK16_05345 [Candidatus Nanohalobium sp.]
MSEKFDKVVAAYLLNYAETRNQLDEMAEKIKNHLREDGEFCALVPTGGIRPVDEFRYGRKIEHSDEKKEFKDGDKIILVAQREEREPIRIENYFWSKETYKEVFENKGFEVDWIKPHVTEEGIEKYGEEEWEIWRERPTSWVLKASII